MRYFIYYPPKNAIRLIDVGDSVLVDDILQLVKQEFGLNVEDSGPAESSIVLNYNGSDLKPKWSLGDLSIPSGAMIRCIYREIKAPELYIHCGFNKQVLKLFDESITIETTLSTIRRKISDQLGLPLSTFCLESQNGQQRFYDEQRLMDYDIKIHDHLYLKVWRGYEKLIASYVKGFTEPYSPDDLTRHYQTQIALYIAAFYGHMELATSVMQMGARSDRPVGEHPSRQWSSEKTVESLAENLKCPIHVAVERGQVKMVDLFVRQSILCTQIRDPIKGYLPYRLALACSLKAKSKEERQRYRVIYFYLYDKQFNLQIPLNASGEAVSNLLTSTVSAGAIHHSLGNHVYISLKLYCRIISWYERARERAWKKYGGRFYNPSQSKRVYPKKGLLGYKVLIDGYNNNFEVPNEPLRGQRPYGTPSEQNVCFVGFSEEERQKILRMKSLVKQTALDDRTRAKQIATSHLQQSRRPPNLLNQRSTDTQKQYSSSSSSSETTSSSSRINFKVIPRDEGVVGEKIISPTKINLLSNRPTLSSAFLSSIPIDAMSNKDVQPYMSSVDAYALSSSLRTRETEQQRTKKRRELMNALEQSIENQPTINPRPPTLINCVTRNSTLDLDSYLPLPDHPSGQRSGPIKSRLDLNIHQSTVKPYERYASASTRKTAVNCLQEAGYFKGKSWLRQVEISKEMVKHRVKRRIRRADQSSSETSSTVSSVVRKPNLIHVN